MGLATRFEAELRLIADPMIQEFARRGLDAAPAYLGLVPASVSVCHHPKDERGEGGRLLHMRRVAVLAHGMAEPLGWDERTRDCMVAAALLHDIVVLGASQTPMDRLWKAHDRAAVDYLENHGGKKLLRLADWIVITEAMQGHMGQWASEPYLKPKPGTLGHYLHMADYIASETYVHIDPLE